MTLVPAWRASSDERHAALTILRATAVVRQLAREGNHAVLTALCGLATGSGGESLSRLTDGVLATKICAALESHRLLALPGDGVSALPDPAAAPAAAGRAASPEQRLISSVMSGRPALSYQGTRYRLVAVEASATPRHQSDYVSLPPGEATEILKDMAGTLAKSGNDQSLWAQISEAVSRPPDKARIVLFKWKAAVAAPPPVATAPAPKRAPAPVAEQTWIEIEIVFDDGTPFAGNCVVELPGNLRTEGAPDSEGLIRLEKIDPGSCKVSFPDLDAAVWDVA